MSDDARDAGASTELQFWRPPDGLLPDRAWFGLAARRGGVSAGPFATLNLGLEVERESREAVAENRRRVLAALDIAPPGPARVIQVHGTRIVEEPGTPCEADGILLRAEGRWGAVTAADCAPVAVVAADGSRGALLHCGWRGAAKRIATRAVALLGGLGHAPSTLRAAIGPCLHACCFPVGPEVAAEFPPGVLRPHPSGRVALDLPAAIIASLREAGLPAGAVHAAAECTSCRAEWYYSHRRDRGLTGRHWALLHLGAPR